MLRSLPTSTDGRYDAQVKPPTEYVDPNASHSKIYGFLKELEEDKRFGPIIDDPKLIVSAMLQVLSYCPVLNNSL